jgi:hypothetical protein
VDPTPELRRPPRGSEGQAKGEGEEEEARATAVVEAGRGAAAGRPDMGRLAVARIGRAPRLRDAGAASCCGPSPPPHDCAGARFHGQKRGGAPPARGGVTIARAGRVELPQQRRLRERMKEEGAAMVGVRAGEEERISFVQIFKIGP